MRKIYIEKAGEKNLIYLVENGRMQETVLTGSDLEIGQIYRAAITEIIDGKKLAFVDIGAQKRGILNDAKNLKPGDTVLVQVTRCEAEEKGPRLSRDLKIEGEYLILLIESKGIKISKKINSDISGLKWELEERMKDRFGIIIRSSCEDAENETILKEYESLESVYEYVIKQRNFLPTPKKIWPDDDGTLSSIKSMLDGDTEIIINDKTTYDKLKDKFTEIKLNESHSLKNDKSLYDDYEDIFRDEIFSESGVYLNFETTKIGTAIDVNSGSHKQTDIRRDFVNSANEWAAREIATLIRRKGLGGRVLIDFIGDMSYEQERFIKKIFYENLNSASRKTAIYGLSAAGIFEIIMSYGRGPGEKVF